jgi:peptidoglycan/LPS O-acetylase OafA/YrhL
MGTAYTNYRNSRRAAFYEFAMKRFIRIYPLYWIVFGAATVMMIWLPSASSFVKKPDLELLFLVNSLPNYRVQAAPSSWVSSGSGSASSVTTSWKSPCYGAWENTSSDDPSLPTPWSLASE